MNSGKPLKPSPFITRLFKWLCQADFFEELQGDLEEKFFENAERLGPKKAQQLYAKEVLLMVRPSVIKRPFKIQKLIMISLLYMNFKLTLRNLVRHKVFSAVNIFGLAAALSVCLFMVNVLHTSFNFDQQQEHLSRLYRIETIVDQKDVAHLSRFATMPYPAVAQLKEAIPDIEQSCQISKNASASYMINGEASYVFGIETEPSFTEMFNFEVIEGDLSAIFEDINAMAITDKAARRLFSDENPIGKVSTEQKVIVAVVKSPYGNSHMNFDMITGLPPRKDLTDKETPFNLSWAEFYSNYAYVMLNEGVDLAAFNQRVESTFTDRMNDLSGMEDTHFDFRAKAVERIVYRDPVMNEIGLVVGPEGFLTFTIMIAVLMFIAGFNYTNLSVARAIQRTKEIGIRKVSGSTNFQIASQILVETLVFSLLGLFLGIGIYRYFSDDFIAMIPIFDGLFNPELDISILLTFLGFSMVTGLMAGLFPAIHFSRINPLNLFNTRLKSKKISLMWIRKGLTTFQLTLSMFCVVFVTMLYKQAYLIRDAPQGIETENRLIMRTSQHQAQLLKPLIDKIPTVKSSSILSAIPGNAMGPTLAFQSLLLGDSIKGVRFFFADDQIDEVLAPKLLDGRFFNPSFKVQENREVLVNERLLQLMGIELTDAVGHSLRTQDSFFTIVGVFEDIALGNPFNHRPDPVMIVGANGGINQGTLLVHLDQQNRENTLNQMEDAWEEVHEEARFSPEYLDTYLEKPIQEFINLVKAQGYVAFAVIAISLLGQLGISLYNAETRVKEIGIRKVLGAKISSIIKLLVKGTIIPLIIATLIASPIAYYLFQDGIASSIRLPLPIGPGLFLQCLFLLSALVVGVVVSQTWRIARLNPAESLRSE